MSRSIDAADRARVAARAAGLLAVAERFLGSREQALEAVLEAMTDVLSRPDARLGFADEGEELRLRTLRACLERLPACGAEPLDLDRLLPEFDANGRHARTVTPLSHPCRDDFLAALRRLPDAERAAVFLCDVEGLPLGRAAALTGGTSAALSRSRDRGRRALVSLLGVRSLRREEPRATMAGHPRPVAASNPV